MPRFNQPGCGFKTICLKIIEFNFFPLLRIIEETKGYLNFKVLLGHNERLEGLWGFSEDSTSLVGIEKQYQVRLSCI